MTKVIIAGSRKFGNYKLLKQKCDFYLKNLSDIEIVSGHANGADKLGEKYSKEMGYSLKLFPADWDNLGKRAGFVRNEEMAKYSDYLIAFWDGESKGTKHMIALAESYGLKIKIVLYNNE